TRLTLGPVPRCQLYLPVVGYVIPGRVGRAHDTKIGRFSKYSGPPLSHHRISDERYHRNTLHRSQVLPLLGYDPPRILEWLELNVTGPGHIKPNRPQPHH